MLDRLGEFVVPYQRALESEAAHHPMHLYLQGLLSQLPRKNAEAIAAWVDVERQVIQDFIGIASWNHQPLVTVLVGEVAEQLGEPDGIIAFDPSSFPKRGAHSVGVKRQWCGHRGKVDNCQVGVFMGYVSRHDHALLDFRLSLPEEWARDAPRRQACYVPPEVRYQTRQEQCVEMLDAWGNQVPHGWVTGDDELGRHTQFRGTLRERGERYVLGVPCTTTMRDLEAPLPEYAGRGRRPKAPWQAVTDWRKSLRSRDVGLQSLHDPIDTTTSHGRLSFHLFAALAEFERDLIRERTCAGLAAARARGRKGGRPKGLSRQGEATAGAAETLYRAQQLSVQQIADQLGISKRTLDTYLHYRGVSVGAYRTGPQAAHRTDRLDPTLSS